MVTNALVPALPSFYEYQLLPHRYLRHTSQQHSQEIVLPRIADREYAVQNQSPDQRLPFKDRQALQKRTFPAGDFLPGFAHRRGNTDKVWASACGDAARLSDTYDRDGVLNTSPPGKGTYVDFYF